MEAVSADEPITDRKVLDGEIRDASEGFCPDKTVLTLSPDASQKPELVSLEETGGSRPQAKETSGRRFFVQADRANVRDRPSMKSNVLFQVMNLSALGRSSERHCLGVIGIW